MNTPSPRPSPADAGEGAKPPIDSFFELLERALAQQRFVKLVLAKYRGAEADLVRVSVRPVLLQSEPCLTFVSNY